MLLFGMFATALAVGVMAQVWKGRTGVLWFFLTGVVEFAVLSLTIWSTLKHPGTLAGTSEELKQMTLTLMTCGFGGGAMALAVASLPATKAAPQPDVAAPDAATDLGDTGYKRPTDWIGPQISAPASPRFDGAINGRPYRKTPDGMIEVNTGAGMKRYENLEQATEAVLRVP